MDKKDLIAELSRIINIGGTLVGNLRACMDLDVTAFTSIVQEMRIPQRTKDMVLRIAAGETLRSVGEYYGISSTRVGQIVHKATYELSRYQLEHVSDTEEPTDEFLTYPISLLVDKLNSREYKALTRAGVKNYMKLLDLAKADILPAGVTHNTVVRVHRALTEMGLEFPTTTVYAGPQGSGKDVVRRTISNNK